MLLRALRYVYPPPAVPAFNTVLDDAARLHYRRSISLLWLTARSMMRRKLTRANVQQGFMLAAVAQVAKRFCSPKILCVGSFEDTAAVALQKLGYAMDTIDPVLNVDLDAYWHANAQKRGTYQIVFSTSVIEHVPDDELFVRQIADFLAPDAVAILTCDFCPGYKPGDRIPPEDVRFYTAADLQTRLPAAMPGCELLDEPTWDRGSIDFEYAGVRYAFGTFAVKRAQRSSGQ